MSLSMDQLKAAFGNADKQEGGSRPNNYYPFWNMKDGEQCIVRFLPDANPDNPMGFMVEKRTHTLTINGENKTVPCPTMFGEKCPICEVSGSYYKAEDRANGKKYWRKKQHIAQALVVEDPLPADNDTGETHEGKVRFVALGYQLYNIIKEAFESGELDEIPYAYEGGTDFIIKKSKQGEYSTYALGSKFARKSRDLTEDEVALAQDQIVDLATLLPQPMEEEKLHSMLEAAMNGTPMTEGASTPTPTPAATPATDSAPVATTEASSTEDSEDGNDEADQILAAIRSRRSKKAE